MILPSMKLKNSSAVGGEIPKGRSSASPPLSFPSRFSCVCVPRWKRKERMSQPIKNGNFCPLISGDASGKVDIFFNREPRSFLSIPPSPLYFHRIVADRTASYITRREVGKTRHQREERKGCELSLLPPLLLLPSWGKLVPTQKSHVP